MAQWRSMVTVTALTLCATPLGAQYRGVIFRLDGGGYSHTRNLNTGEPFAHFKLGWTVATGIGMQFNKYFAVGGDFTFGRTKGLGDVDFIGDEVNRYYLGARVDLRYPIGERFVPYLFGGGGRMWVDQSGIESQENFQHFNRYAGTFGAGLAFEIPATDFAVFGEGKGLYYKWTAAPFNRSQLDLTYAVGASYRLRF